MAQMGRKPKVDYWLTEDGKTMLTGWARQGLSNAQLAKNMGISETTFYEWKAKHTDISEAISKGKDVVDFEVENMLLNRILGQEYEESKTYMKDDGTGKKVKHVEKSTKFLPPDVKAAIFWLKNRQPDRWSERTEVEHSGGMNNTNVNMFQDITTEELKRLANEEED